MSMHMKTIEEIALRLTESWGRQNSVPDRIDKFIENYKFTLESLEEYYEEKRKDKIC